MSEKLNVLFIITDAQRADHLGSAGNPVLKTPNIDRIADEGVRFTNYFCTNPICMPNRATLATGVYPNVHGIRSNGINLPETTPTIYSSLRKRGWHTAAIGKIHHQYWLGAFKYKYRSMEGLDDWATKKVTSKTFPTPYYGFEEVEVISGNGTVCAGHYLEWLEEHSPTIAEKMRKRVRNYNNLFSLFCEEIPEELYNTNFVTERTIAFLERYAKGTYGEKPFFLQCSFPDPHYPLYPPTEYQKMYDPDQMKLPANFDDINNLYDHEFLGNLLRNPPFKRAFIRISTEDEVRKIIALTYAAISYVDHSIGNILAALDKLGYSDNTMVIFTSDHGDLMGEHGLLFKGPCPFNGPLQIPLIWKIPGINNTKDSDSLVSTIDIPKTLMNLLDVKERHQPPNMQGYDITPILQNSKEKVRECIYIENDEEIGTLESRLRHLVTENYKLTVYETMPNFGDIYDRVNDPLELHNLWNHNDFKDQKSELIRICLNETLNALRKEPKRIAGT